MPVEGQIPLVLVRRTSRNVNFMQKTSVIIIGAGPAGLTAALQFKRFGIPFLLFEGRQVGGLLHNANLVENYPGFPRGVTGSKLVSLFKKQIENLGVDVIAEKVTSLEFDGESFLIKTETFQRNGADLTGFQNLSGLSCNEYSAKIAIIASGTKARQFDEKIIALEAKSRVFYEVRDLLDIENQEIIIVGAGDAAFDYALNLVRRDNRVTILNRGKEIKALGLLQERVRENTRISYEEEVLVEKIRLVESTDTQYALRNTHLSVEVSHRENVEIMEASFLLGALGRIPNLDFLGESIQSREKELMGREILYFIGDVRNGIYRQTAIAAGDGLRAAMQIDQFFKEKK